MIIRYAKTKQPTVMCEVCRKAITPQQAPKASFKHKSGEIFVCHGGLCFQTSDSSEHKTFYWAEWPLGFLIGKLCQKYASSIVT